MKADNSLVLESGGVESRVLYRHGQRDEGWTFHVFSKTSQVEILRFDCFEKGPHYHYAPDGKNEIHKMSKDEIPVPLDWTLTQLKTRLSAMIEEEGYKTAPMAPDQEAIAEIYPSPKVRLEG